MTQKSQHQSWHLFFQKFPLGEKLFNTKDIIIEAIMEKHHPLFPHLAYWN
jgi:hypothetical protein